ncbi:DNA-binding response regulator [Massilia sp. TS11]|uniref:response regulator transcription factor n=1 Tax=Massilia sp. TS11 TaxID=2908003 RepID=UPI001EDA8C99|nr:DNA-binding response regulator [Massilia sp. TS11]MCG2582921.1 DNA-binding response regulator [Massilia sp. TS11]
MMNKNSSQYHLLIIEDAAVDRAMLSEMLTADGHRISVAEDGSEGYRLALAKLPDLIILDVGLPGMHGHALCRRLKANAQTRAIPIIFLSAADGPDDRVTGLQIGAVDYITKPFTPAEVSARVRIHLGLMPKPAAATAAPDEHPLVLAAKTYIRDHIGDLPPLADIARAIGTYREKLSKVFREQTGMTVFAFIRDERIQHACRLLGSSDLDIVDIALSLNFSSAGNFSTAFRLKMGMTPSAYRQQEQSRQ